jgi:hypothetical protein
LKFSGKVPGSMHQIPSVSSSSGRLVCLTSAGAVWAPVSQASSPSGCKRIGVHSSIEVVNERVIDALGMSTRAEVISALISSWFITLSKG